MPPLGAPIYKCGYRDGLDAIDENGYVQVPQGPGLGMEPMETVRVLQKYGNPDVTCITNTHPIFPMGAILSEENRYPGPDSLEETIRSFSKTA